MRETPLVVAVERWRKQSLPTYGIGLDFRRLDVLQFFFMCISPLSVASISRLLYVLVNAMGTHEIAFSNLQSQKRVVLILNKIDLVPKEVVQAWLT